MMVKMQSIFTPELRQRMGELTEAAIPELVDGLRSVELDVYRYPYFDLLAEIGSPAVPALISLLSDDDLHIRETAALYLGKTQAPSDAVSPALIKALSDERSVAITAAVALSNLNAGSDIALPLLTDYLQRQIESGASADYDEEHTCMDVIEAIGRFTPPSAESAAVLISALRDRSLYVRRTAATELGKMGSIAKAAIPALTTVATAEPPHESGPLRKFFDDVRLASTEAIHRINGAGGTVD